MASSVASRDIAWKYTVDQLRGTKDVGFKQPEEIRKKIMRCKW